MTGTIEFERTACRRGETVRATVDATLDSEFLDRPSVEVVGQIETVLGEALEAPD